MFLEIAVNDLTVVRPELLNYAMNSNLDLQLDLGFDLGFDVDISSSEPSSLLSPRTQPSSQSSLLEDEMMLDLQPGLDILSPYKRAGGINIRTPSLQGLNQPLDTNILSLAMEEPENAVHDSFFDVLADGSILFTEAMGELPVIAANEDDIALEYGQSSRLEDGDVVLENQVRFIKSRLLRLTIEVRN